MQLIFNYENPDLTPRPIFTAVINREVSMCLYDTGADISVSCSMDWLKRVSKKLIKDGTLPLSGFGGTGTLCPIYNLGSVALSDLHGNSFVYDNFRVVAVNRKDFAVDIILGAGLFKLCATCLMPYKGEMQVISGYNHFKLTYNNDIVNATAQSRG